MVVKDSNESSNTQTALVSLESLDMPLSADLLKSQLIKKGMKSISIMSFENDDVKDEVSLDDVNKEKFVVVQVIL